jgi:hypothetical protein
VITGAPIPEPGNGSPSAFQTALQAALQAAAAVARRRGRREREREMSFAVLGPANGAAVITFEVSSDKVLTWDDREPLGRGALGHPSVFGKKPLREFMGPGLDSIELPIRLDKARGVIPATSSGSMRKQRDEGNVLQFTIGDQLVGDWVVEDIQETWTRFDKKGVLLVAEVRLSLGEYQ